MSAESGNKIAVFIGTHGEEMEVGGRLLQKLQTRPLAGVVHRVAHPEAVAAGKRYVGTSPDAMQIMSRYPDNPDGDPEQRAAYANLQWLKEINPVTVQDIHESNLSGSYFVVGERTTVATIACARMLGPDTCIVNNSASFYRNAPNSAVIENSLADSKPLVTAHKIYEGLERASSVNLQNIPFAEARSGVTFYQKFEICSFGADGQVLPWLKDLEKVANQPTFFPLDLTNAQKEQLTIPSEANIFYGSWSHQNMSRVSEKLGHTHDETPRREWFGDFFIRIAPPLQTGDRDVIFQRENRPLSRTPNGLLQLA